ncbi:AAA family ATPase [Skermania piniformis]|uniref:AAA family ATPase n=1 Tax=Skermania pinensis TaxID=39122 RepID=A0ABX8SA08_9ACTN|nr:AAA family ATPase [Skermania piniformis]QXQ13400.1 AAA family ATPase [Skermania piniformis]
MAQPLASVTIAGFRSIDRLRLPLSSEVTLLVGANGSGKSNIVDALELLGYTVDGKLQSYVARQGFGRMLHRGWNGGTAEEIVVMVWSEWTDDPLQGPFSNGYTMTLRAAAGDSAILDERVQEYRDVPPDSDSYPKSHDVHLGRHRESALQSATDATPTSDYLARILAGCRVFHFDDTSIDAPPLRSVDTADYDTLHDDARNLAAVLLNMAEHSRSNYDRVVRSVRGVAPFFDDFVLKPVGDIVLLRWRERGIDDVFGGSALSSGTLRFICLATLLQQPNPPTTIVLDEPELGLHPAAIHQLAELMRAAARGRRIVAATQSVTLLGQFSIDDVAVVERVAGSTTVARPDREQLATWLQDYSLGELWEMNLLGGRPRASDATRPTS